MSTIIDPIGILQQPAKMAPPESQIKVGLT